METLFNILKENKLIGFLEKLPASAALVTGAAVKTSLAEEASLVDVPVIDVETLAEADFTDAQKLYVLLFRRETGHVKALKHQFPDKEIISITYDVLPGLMGVKAATIEKESIREPRVMVAATGSGYEILAKGLQQTNVADFQEYIKPDLCRLLVQYRDFSLIRFLREIQKLCGEGQFDMLFTMDVLWVLFERDIITLSHIAYFFNGLEGRALYFSNRDKSHEAVVATCLFGTRYRAQSDVPVAERQAVFGTIDDEKVFLTLNMILRAQSYVEKILEELGRFRYITTWDIKKNLPAVIENISLFLEEEVNGSAHDVSADDAWLDEIAGFSAAVQNLKNTLQEFLQ